MPHPVSVTLNRANFPARRSCLAGNVLLGQHDLTGRNHQLAPVGHRVAGVDRQIDHDLFNHRHVGQHEQRVWRQIAAHHNASSQQRPKHLRDVRRHRVQIQHLRLHHLFAAERQHLPDQFGRPLHAGNNLGERLHGILVQLGVVQQQRGVALDDSQDVVELMRHPRGHLAHRRQPFLAQDDFLAFHQGLLRLFAFRHLLLQILGPFINQSEQLLIPLLPPPPPPPRQPVIDPIPCQQQDRRAHHVKNRSFVKRRRRQQQLPASRFLRAQKKETAIPGGDRPRTHQAGDNDNPKN